MRNEAIRHYLTVYAAAFIFIVFGLWEIINPVYWSGFVPSFISKVFSNVNLLVEIHGIVLTLLGICFVFEFKRKIASVLGTLIMLDIVFSLFLESGFSDLLVRDIIITILIVSIFFDDYKKDN